MDEGKVISITVAADLLAKAEETAAREQRTVNELITDAVSRYLASDPEWEALLQRTRAAGKRLGLQSGCGTPLRGS
jgi:metal-responsive CopG/Arc/MetJ family transcriptional regulator